MQAELFRGGQSPQGWRFAAASTVLGGDPEGQAFSRGLLFALSLSVPLWLGAIALLLR